MYFYNASWYKKGRDKEDIQEKARSKAANSETSITNPENQAGKNREDIAIR